jgi:hypothetical protein
VHLLATMFRDSLAPTWTPKGLFHKSHGCRLTAPGPGGYLIEAEASRLKALSQYIREAESIEARTAISRVKSVSAFFGDQTIRGHSATDLWEEAEEVDGGRAFVLWLAPFRSDQARAALIERALQFEGRRLLNSPRVPPRGIQTIPDGPHQRLVVQDAVRAYRNTGSARAVATLPSQQALERDRLSMKRIRCW